jgi:hypothetical protein
MKQSAASFAPVIEIGHVFVRGASAELFQEMTNGQIIRRRYTWGREAKRKGAAEL